mgnify:CR=1 FL=1
MIVVVVLRVRVVVRVRLRVRDHTQPDAGTRRRPYMTDRPLLDHENLDVYRVSIAFLRLAFDLLAKLPKTQRELRSQLERAAMSIPLNIAEGAGRATGPDRARFHATARGSAMECGAILDVCRVAGYAPEPLLDDGKLMLSRMVAMLTKMCR